MKLLIFSAVAAWQLMAAGPKLHLETFTSRGNAVLLAADHIQRSASLVQLRGNVEIRMRPSGSDRDVMVLHADQADYHRDTDQIVPRGNVRVSLEKPK